MNKRIRKSLTTFLAILCVATITDAKEQNVSSRINLKRKAPIEKVRYVRIELPGNKKEALTLAEVEVRSGGRNIALDGKARQSSTGFGGIAYHAIDGVKNPKYQLSGSPGQSHTNHAAGNWWELDLGGSFTIDEIEIWNRERMFAHRLNGFTLQLLNEKRQQVFARYKNAAPDGSILFNFSKNSHVAYRGHDGKPNAPMQTGADPAKNQSGLSAHRDPVPFAFQKGDTIALIGNGLADRMQHDGWVETLLQRETSGLNLSFRNMSISGDRANSYPRSTGFTPMNAYLKHVKADVIFCFFGYNESFGKAEKLSHYENQLKSMVQSLRETRASGKNIPRIVLFSPIAHENLRDPNLPDGKKNNANLELYTMATAKVADEVGVSFVDLFEPTNALFEDPNKAQALTLNGIHLTAEGNRQLGQIIAKALLKRDISIGKNAPSLLKLKDAVMDKNWYWHNRYRATSGNDIWGGRSKLKYMDGQTNATVLQHELIMLDQLAANRDQHIWATAQGRDHRIDDSNVPPAILVKTNIGSRDDSNHKEGSSDYKSPAETMASIKVPEGFKLNLFADEERFPQLANPVQLQVDTQGRLWAASWNSYPKWEPLKPMNDALLIFPDDNKDGVADRCIEFAKVHNPVGFEFWNGGVIVTCQPDILFLKDTDGDDIADIRQVLIQGIGSADTHHAANNLLHGPDGAIYWQSGVFLHNNHETPWGPSLKTGASGLYRFDPRRYTVSFHADGYSPNPHGTCFDYWGYHYAQDGTGGRSVQIRQQGKGFKSYALCDRLVRPATNGAIISSANFPDEIQQNYIYGNVIGFLGLKHFKLHREGFRPKNYGFGQVWGTLEEDFVVGSDKNFRLTDVEFGEDGALYIADWHNVIIGHLQHNLRDPSRDHTHGRIYRMVYEKKPLQQPVKIDGQPIADLLDNLKHPIDGVRHRTRIELSERDSKGVIAELGRWITQFDPKRRDHAHHLLEALWLHQQHNVRNEELLNHLLNSPQPHAVEAAKTVEFYWKKSNPARLIQAPVVNEDHHTTPKVKVPAHLKNEEVELFKLGAEVYHREAHCATCHQNDGNGLGEIYPPINASEWATGDPERLIKLTLHGLWGEITVNDKTYHPDKGVPPMTAFHSILDDTETAAVLTFIRNHWSNKGSPVYPQDVKKVREATKDRDSFYKAEDLLREHPHQ